jgi:hypothetical protein
MVFKNTVFLNITKCLTFTFSNSVSFNKFNLLRNLKNCAYDGANRVCKSVLKARNERFECSIYIFTEVSETPILL